MNGGYTMNYSSRKFILVLISLGILTAGLFTKFIDASNFVIGLIAMTTAYLGANTIETKLGGK